MELFTNAGLFIYPLGVCSFVAVFITFERLLALRHSRVVPAGLLDDFLGGSLGPARVDASTVAGRIIRFNVDEKPDGATLKAYARLEVNRMERGVFLLDVVIGAAPLLGLLGTVTGLTRVFSGFSAETGLPDPATFIAGIALALNTTILGLAIAIPALAAHAYLLRRVEAHATRVGLGVEALLNAKQD